MVGSGFKLSHWFRAGLWFLTTGGTDTANLFPAPTTANNVYGTAATTANFFDTSGADLFTGTPTL